MSGWPCTCTHSLSHSAPPRDVANLTTCVMHVRAICGAQAIEAFELALNAQSNYNAFLGRGSALAMMRNVRACQGSFPPPPPKHYPSHTRTSSSPHSLAAPMRWCLLRFTITCVCVLAGGKSAARAFSLAD